MINFYTETNFCHQQERKFIDWLVSCIIDYGFILDEINYIFVDDIYLHKMNMEYYNMILLRYYNI